mmetsp:Transcript_3815/g.9257  ORF Transcript_3815/g.9257 Transcript_3815/m.9257 type:complete len:94 (-) Transcript_3815:256-537(-)
MDMELEAEQVPPSPPPPLQRAANAGARGGRAPTARARGDLEGLTPNEDGRLKIEAVRAFAHAQTKPEMHGGMVKDHILRRWLCAPSATTALRP